MNMAGRTSPTQDAYVLSLIQLCHVPENHSCSLGNPKISLYHPGRADAITRSFLKQQETADEGDSPGEKNLTFTADFEGRRNHELRTVSSSQKLKRARK